MIWVQNYIILYGGVGVYGETFVCSKYNVSHKSICVISVSYGTYIMIRFAVYGHPLDPMPHAL